MSMSPPIISSVNHLNVSTNSCGRTAFAYTVTNVLSIVLDPTDFEYADITFDYFTQIAPYVFCSNRLWCAFICDGGVNLVDACYIKYVSRLCGSMLSISWLTARTAAVFRYLCQASCSLWFGLGLSTCQQPMNWGECSSSMIASTILLCLRFCSFSARCWWQRRRCNPRVWKQFGLVLAWHKRIRCQTDHHYHWPLVADAVAGLRSRRERISNANTNRGFWNRTGIQDLQANRVFARILLRSLQQHRDKQLAAPLYKS